MPKRRDPSKQITAVAIDIRRGKVRPVLFVNGDTPLIIEHDGLTEAQAVLVIDGYVDGLRSGSDLDEELIEAFLEDPRAVHRLETPFAMSASDVDLFKLGALGGLSLAARGYWMDTTQTGAERTLH